MTTKVAKKNEKSQKESNTGEVLTPIADLVPNPKNPRKHTEESVQYIVRSIARFGWKNPMLVLRRNNMILAGHGRLLAAKILQLESVPVRFIDNMTDLEALAYTIADNAVGERSGWDWDMYREQVNELKMADFDLQSIGIPDSQLQSMLDSMHSVEGKEYDESVAAGVELQVVFKLRVPMEQVDEVEAKIDELLKDYPTVKKEKIL